MTELDYPFIVRRLSPAEGGGYLVEVPDLPGCMADGETLDEAIEDARQAIEAWAETAKEMGRAVPRPGDAQAHSGRWVQRVPRWLHGRLAARAKQEGVSLNAFVTSLLAAAVGRPKARSRKRPKQAIQP